MARTPRTRQPASSEILGRPRGMVNGAARGGGGPRSGKRHSGSDPGVRLRGQENPFSGHRR